MYKRFCLLISMFIFIAGCGVSSSGAKSPKNIILFIGDGMGPAQITLARISKAGKNSKLEMDSLKYGGLIHSRSADSLITDSAAAATALATGYKTNNGMISTLPNGKVVKNILEAAKAMGKSVGLVTNTTVTHATPACFGSHVPSRASEADIAPQYINKDIEVIMGGGLGYFIPSSAKGSYRKDSKDLIAAAKAKGYFIALDKSSMESASSKKLIGLFEIDALTTNVPEPSLRDMAVKAVQILRKDPDGFFLMIEGGQIDWRNHANDAPGMIKQLYDFDKAIGDVLKSARINGDTLIIVTADHESGGLTICDPDAGTKDAYKAKWATGGHSGVDLPILAEGPGAELFTGIKDNTQIPINIAKLWKIKGFPSAR